MVSPQTVDDSSFPQPKAGNLGRARNTDRQEHFTDACVLDPRAERHIISFLFFFPYTARVSHAESVHQARPRGLVAPRRGICRHRELAEMPEPTGASVDAGTALQWGLVDVVD